MPPLPEPDDDVPPVPLPPLLEVFGTHAPFTWCVPLPQLTVVPLPQVQGSPATQWPVEQ
jgi:hypothetical protein